MFPNFDFLRNIDSLGAMWCWSGICKVLFFRPPLPDKFEVVRYCRPVVLCWKETSRHTKVSFFQICGTTNLVDTNEWSRSYTCQNTEVYRTMAETWEMKRKKSQNVIFVYKIVHHSDYKTSAHCTVQAVF